MLMGGPPPEDNSIRVERLDHLVLTVRSIEVACNFYRDVLGMEVITFAGDRKALRLGSQKINLHAKGGEFEPHAAQATSGSANFCLITRTPKDEVIELLASRGIQIVEGPVNRTGAMGSFHSVYFRNPDGNLLEISKYPARSTR